MSLLLRAQFNRAAVALLLALVVPASTALRVPRAQVGPRGGRWTTATTTTTQSRALITSRRTHHRHRHGGGVWMMAMARDSGTVAANAAAQGVTKQNSIIEDDGFSTRYGRKLGWFGRLQVAIRNFIKMIFGLYPKQAGTLILVRHGESSFNFNSTFTGWVDADLSDRGRREMEHAGRLLLERGYNIDVAYTSRLKRAIRSSWIMLRELNNIFRPVYKSYRLNERMYGALEGLSKPGLAREMGKDVVIKYRTSLTERPPPMTPDHPFYHGKEAKYADLDPSELPLTESLEDCMKRSLPLYETRIAPDLKKGYNVLVVAHGNSLRGIVKHIDQLSADQIQRVGIPNGIPLVYKFDQNLKPIRSKARENEDDFLSGEFLEKKGLLRSALAQEAELSQKIPGYDLFDGNITGLEKVLRYSPPLDPRLNSLFRLDKERLLLEYVEKKDAGTDSSAEEAAKTAGAAAAMRRRYALSGGLPQKNRKVGSTASSVAIKSTGTTALAASSGRPAPLLVIMRHGKTEHNKLGLFTGWEDAALSSEGRNEAREAGRLMRAHGLQFDIVYTSWLSRAIETAWLVLNELDALWLPLIKTWRLNERMYGSLTGLSKKMTAEKYGNEQLKKWRRSYDTRPPPVSSFSTMYPGNDERYVKYVRDVPISYFETIVRTLAERRLQIHRAFPKTESLKDCMERTIPYFLHTIKPNSIDKGKNVLIASSENAIRGLLMELCEIPADRVQDIEIPTGLPLVLDLEKKCVRLLDNGKGEDVMEKYNFGASPELLFRPCDAVEAADGDGLCYVDGEGRLYSYDPVVPLPADQQPVEVADAVMSEGPAKPVVFSSFELGPSAESALL